MPSDPSPRLAQGALAGLLAGVCVLLAGAAVRLSGGPASMPELLFNAVVASTPGRIESQVISLLRHAAKPLLLAASAGLILLACAAAGAAFEFAGRRRTASRGRLLVLALAPFILGGAAVGLAPGSVEAAELAVASLGSQVAFAGALGLWRLGHTPAHAAASQRVRRREVLRAGANLVFAVITGTFAVQAVRKTLTRLAGPATDVVTVPPPTRAEGLFRRSELATLVSREVTPTPRFYRVSKNALDPEIAAGGWKLAVGGLVARPGEYTLEDLRRLPRLERYQTLMCISNEIGDGLIGNASWAGLRLTDLLEAAGILPDARFVTFRCADGYVESITLDQARQTLLAYSMNGASLESRHGFPVRALVPGTYGMKNPKWIVRIEAAATQEQGFWNKLGWDAGAPPKIFSRFDVPRSGAVVPAGKVVLGGIAFAGDRGISRVEVSDDGGRLWQPAELRPALSPVTWVLWAMMWTPKTVSSHSLMVRATDGAGVVQSPEIRPPFPSGVSGYHRITLTVEGAQR